MPMALAIYPGFHGREGFDMPLGEQPHVIIPNQQILTTVYQNEQILQMKMRMRDEELKALYMHQENQVKSLERAKAFLSQESLERRFDELQAKIEEKYEAIIVSTYRGCVILFLTFESQRKFEHFWGSCASGRLSDTLSELLITEEMRTLEGGDQLVVKTLVLEQDYKAWRDFYGKGDPQTTKDEQVEQVTSQMASLDTSKQTEELQYKQKTWAKSIQSVTSTVSSGSIRTSSSGYSSAGSHMSEGREIAAKYKAAIATLTEGMENLARKLTDMTEDCDQVKKEIQQHYKRLILKLQLEEQEMISKVDRAKRDRKNELLHRKEEMDRELGKTKEDLELCQKTLDSDIIGDTEMETRLHYDQLVSRVTGNRTFGGRRAVTFQPCSLSQVSGGSLSLFAGFSIDIEGPAVESFPSSVTVTPDSIVGLTGKNAAPQIEVTSPQGKTTLIQTTAHSSLSAEGKGQTSGVVRVWGAEWRPQTSGKHTLGVCMGDRRDLGSLTVDVGSNNPVLRFGQKGSQQGQFDRPVDVAVRGDRLYVADTWNQRVQVFDLSGKFCFSFSTAAYPVGLAVQADGTIVMNSCEEVKKFSPSGKLLHIFSLGEYCTDPYGLAVQRDGRVVVTEPDKHSIFLFEADGTLVKQVGGQGQFNQPYFVCVDKEDNIIVSDYGNNRVQVFDNNLNFQRKFGLYGRQPQDMQWPNGISADSRGNIVLANIGQKSDIGGVEHGRKLQVFRPDGTWVTTISSGGDKLNHPCGVAVTEDGHVFVSDTRDHCIRKYRYL